jgi:hypothetical protein
MSQIQNKSVLITGGASGLGCLLARRLRDEGAAHVVIWDIDAPALTRVVNELSGPGSRVSGWRVDVADPAQVQATVRSIEASGAGIDLLINNAGVVVGKRFVDHTPADIARTMNVNALGAMYLTRELLPGMLARGGGHIVNVASAAGLVSNPRMSVYCASKWAMIGWSDSLRLEMEQARTGVKVTTVMPYYIDTGMFAGVRSPVVPILQPARVAEAIVSAIKQDRILLRLPRVVNLLPLLRGSLPARWFDRVVGDWLGVYRSMDDFTGRG